MKQRFSLAAQIEEVDLELTYRDEVFRRRVSTGQMKQSMSDYRIGRLRAVRATLVWLQSNEAKIKQLLLRRCA